MSRTSPARNRIAAASRRPGRRPGVESLEGRQLLNAGGLDLSFGGSGKAAVQLGTTNAPASETQTALVQPADGKVVLAGLVYSNIVSGDGRFNAPGYQVGAVRYNVDGTLDPTFGPGGKDVLSNPNRDEGLYKSSALQSDGKIVLSAYTRTLTSVYVSPKVGWQAQWGPTSYEAIRLNPNGSLDATFGVGGRATLVNSTAATQAIAVQADGKIVLETRYSDAVAGIETELIRLNPDGSPDTSFGAGGKFLTPPSAGYTNEFPINMAIDASGRILAAGRAYNGHQNVMEIARYTAAGALDPTFGVGGKAFLAPGAAVGLDVAQGIGFQSTGKIVISGLATDPATNAQELTFLRLNTDGTLDGSFGRNGVFFEPRMAWAYPSQPGYVAIDPTNDKILAAADGRSNGTVIHDVYVTRVLADGSASDATFGQGGVASAGYSTTPGLSVDPASLAIDSAGKIAVGGYDASGTGQPNAPQFRAVRFLGDSKAAAFTVSAASSSAQGARPRRGAAGAFRFAGLKVAARHPGGWGRRAFAGR